MSFRWPGNKQLAVSLTFDDGHVTQIDDGAPILNRYGIKATFYPQPSSIPMRLAGWQQLVAQGHEIGSHTKTHPCSGNFEFSAKNMLENFSIQQIAQDISDANRLIHQLLGVHPISFAYPCGQTFVGRGKACQSYVPIVADMFLTGRGCFSECGNNPDICDMANLFAVSVDGKLAEGVPMQLKEAVGRWIIFVLHRITPDRKQGITASDLENLCKLIKSREGEIWAGTVGEVGKYIISQRSAR